MVGGGPFELQPGQWTDDTSMALCLAASLIHVKGFDARDQMNRYCNWFRVGYMSSTGECFDIGLTVRDALNRYLESGDAYAGDPNPRTAGNGALMRLAPIAMFFVESERDTWRYAGESTRTTHGAEETIGCSQLFALQLRAALQGACKEDVLNVQPLAPVAAKVQTLAEGGYRKKSRDQIQGTGYCIQSLEAALWAFNQASNYNEAVLIAANLGDDADTTAAICGQLAGAFYGIHGIKQTWLDKLVMRDEMLEMANELLAISGSR